MKLIIVTDAWEPQINGVVQTLKNLILYLEKNKIEVNVIHPYINGFKIRPMPTYPEVEFVYNPWKIDDLLDDTSFTHIHIATEGPLGIFARLYCEKYDIKFTTSYHTQTPEFLKSVFKIPLRIGYSLMRWLHKPSSNVLVTTKTMKESLETWKLHNNMIVWTRGVDYDLFNLNKRTRDLNPEIKRLICVSRVSVEKNLEKFLSLNIPNTELIMVGDGPMRITYKNIYKNVQFTGALVGEELAKEYANGDVFVFPSMWDTFGLVQIEANGCGVPVATYDSSISSKDVITNGKNGYACQTLEEAIEKCLTLNRDNVRLHAMKNFSWEECGRIFIDMIIKN